MKWNYRVVEITNGLDETYQQIHEVYYDDSNLDKIVAYSREPAKIIWDAEGGIEEGKKELERLRAALDKPVLKFEDLPK